MHRFFARPSRRCFGSEGCPHQLLVTTGYDLALEQALLEAEEEFDVVSYAATGRNRGRFFHRAPKGESRVIELPNTYATELSLERRTVVLKLHGGIDQESFVVTEDDYIGYLARSDVGGAIPVALAASCGAATSSSSATACANGACVSSRPYLGRRATRLPLMGCAPEARPLERQFWRSRDIDLLEQPLDKYLESLAQYLGVQARL